LQSIARAVELVCHLAEVHRCARDGIELLTVMAIAGRHHDVGEVPLDHHPGRTPGAGLDEADGVAIAEVGHIQQRQRDDQDRAQQRQQGKGAPGERPHPGRA
jgi:hypothetical protein